MIEIQTLGNTRMEGIHAAVVDSFSDYPEPYNKSVEEQRYLLERRAYNGSMSFGAFSGNNLVSYTLNGVGEWGGQKTAYDTGTGTIKEFRKQGFEINRELDYYIAERDKVRIKNTGAPIKYQVKVLDKDSIDWVDLLACWAFKPSWQNSVESIQRKLPYFTFLGIYAGDTLAGYGLIEKHTGDVPQFAIAEEYRGRGLGTRLFGELMQYSETGLVRLINSDAAYVPFKKFMESMSIQPGHGQYEMTLQL